MLESLVCAASKNVLYGLTVTALLQAHNLTFAFGETPVLRSAGLLLKVGETVALLGPNGSGKSTLLRCLLGQLPSTGSVQWEGRAVTQWPPRELARRVAYLPQSPAYDVDQTVTDVLRVGRAPYWGAFGLENTRDIQIVREIAGLLKLNALLTRRMDELSGGQRQRVFLGRCLIQEPAALLLDEPNTFLDLRHQVELVRVLHRLARERNVAVLMASHDLNLAAAFADRLVLLSEGEVVAEGTPAEVLEPALLERVYAVPMRRIDDAGQVLVFPRVEALAQLTATPTGVPREER